jgi:ATP-binding cassette subfamily B protein
LEINSLIKSHYLFSVLSEPEIEELSKKMIAAEYKLGEIIVSKDASADFIYFIISGKARIVNELKDGKTSSISTIETGATTGEGAILNNNKFVYTVRSAATTKILKLPYNDYLTLISKYPNIKSLIQERFEYLEFNRFLWKLKIFSTLNITEKNLVFSKLIHKKISAGEYIFREGDNEDYAAIIYKGNVKLVKESINNKLLLKLKSGEFIGESSLLDNFPRFETAIAETDCEIFLFHKDEYLELSKLKKEISDFINQLVENRKIQYDTLLSLSGNTEENEQPELIIENVKIKTGIFSQKITYATTNNPILNGVACLTSILKYYKYPLNLKSVIEKQILTGSPDSLISVSRKFESAGFMTRMVKLNFVQMNTINMPAVIEWENGSLCVLYSYNKKEVILSDSKNGVFKVEINEFIQKWNKKLLIITYVPEFGNSGKDIKKIFKRFIPLAKPYQSLIVGILIVSVLLQLLSLVLPLFSKTIIDNVLVFGDKSLLKLMLIGMLFVTAFQMIGDALRQYLVAHAMRRVSASLLFRFFRHILLLPQKIFLKWQVGDFSTRFAENERLLQLISSNIFKVCVDSITIVVYLVVLLSTNATLTGYSLIFVAGYALTIILSSPILRANDITVFEKLRDSESFIIETVGNIMTVKSMASESIFYEVGIGKFIAHKIASFKGALFAFIITLISNVLTQASTIMVLGMGATLVLKGELTTGELIAFNATFGLLLAPLNGLITMWDDIQQIRVSFERINDVLSLETEPTDLMIITEQLKGNIKIENVSFKYEGSENLTLDNLNLEILAGQKIALVGRSGSGKTTLVNMLNKLLEPTEGKLYFDSRDISEVDAASLRNQIGFVEQQPYLFSGTIKDNITLPAPDISMKKMLEAAKMAGVDEFVSKFPMDYNTQTGERGMTLSGGQKQRIVIARALINDPKILILDEATSALDTETERIVYQNLDSIMKDRTTIIIAHRLSTIINADKIIVMDNGKIVESGTHSELMDSAGLYYYLYQKSKHE